MRFSSNPELRKRCFNDHIKNYEDRLLNKTKKVASDHHPVGLAEDEDENNFNEKDTDKVVSAFATQDGDSAADDDDDDNFLGEEEDNFAAEDDAVDEDGDDDEEDSEDDQ